MAATDARPVPKKNQAYRHYFSIRNKDGSLITGWTGASATRSLDGAAHAPAATPVEIATSSGTGYIDLTAAEMNTDCTVLIVSVTNTDAVSYVVSLFPEDTGDIRSTADVDSIRGTQITEDSLGRVAGNFSTFYNNNDQATLKTVDEVGSTVVSGPKQNFSANSTLSSATETNDHTATHVRDATDWEITATGAGAGQYATLEFTLDQTTGGPGNALSLDWGLASGGMRFMNLEVEDQTNPTNYDLLDTILNTGGGIITTDVNLLAQHTDSSTGLVRLRFWSDDFNIGEDLIIHYCHVVNTADAGTFPSETEIAIAVDNLQSSRHGDGNWQGDIILETFISAVHGTFPQRIFNLSTGPDQDDLLAGEIIFVHDVANNEIDGGVCIKYTGATKEVILSDDLKFTPGVGDEVQVRASTPAFNADDMPGACGGATANTLTLDARDTAPDNTYIGATVRMVSGVADGDSGIVIGHTAGVLTLMRNWTTTPASADVYVIIPGDADSNLSGIAGTAIGESNVGNLANNFGQFYDVNPTSSKNIDHVGDVVEIAGSANAASQLSKSANQIYSGTVDDSTFQPTATSFEASDIVQPLTDHWQPSLVTFEGGPLAGHRANVTGYSLQGGKGRFVVDAMPQAPSNGDTFIII